MSDFGAVVDAQETAHSLLGVVESVVRVKKHKEVERTQHKTKRCSTWCQIFPWFESGLYNECCSVAFSEMSVI